MSCNPCHFSGSGRSAFARSRNARTFSVGSPLLVRKHVPSTPMKSPISSRRKARSTPRRLLSRENRFECVLWHRADQEMALPHVAMGGDAAGGAKSFAFFEFLAHFRNRSAGSKPQPNGSMPFARSASSFLRRSAISSFSSSIFGERM